MGGFLGLLQGSEEEGTAPGFFHRRRLVICRHASACFLRAAAVREPVGRCNRTTACLRARLVAGRNVKARVFPGECSSTRGMCDREWRRTSRARQQAVVRVARPTAPSKTQVNPRSFHGLQCPDGPFQARRDILACSRARFVAWRNVEARVFPGSSAVRGGCAIGNGIVRAARVSKRLYGWHDQPLRRKYG